MVIGNLWREQTKYGCPGCAIDYGEVSNTEAVDLYKRYRNSPNYVGRSRMEFNLYCAIKDKYPDAYPGFKMKGRKEIDIWVPSLNCGVEYNGNYYHSEARGRGKDYHLLKSNTGWLEEKFIFHIFTEEAANIGAIIKSMELFHAYLDVRVGNRAPDKVGRTLHINPLSDGSAKVFHRDHNPVQNFNLPPWDWHFGVYDDNFNLISALSGLRQVELFTKITAIDVGIPMGDVLQAIAKRYKVSPVVWADSRNPLEALVASGGRRVGVSGSVQPLPLPLNSRFEIIRLNPNGVQGLAEAVRVKHPGEVSRAWDAGRLVIHLDGQKPHWLK